MFLDLTIFYITTLKKSTKLRPLSQSIEQGSHRMYQSETVQVLPLPTFTAPGSNKEIVISIARDPPDANIVPCAHKHTHTHTHTLPSLPPGWIS